MFLNLLDLAGIPLRNEVDTHTLTTPAATATDPVQIGMDAPWDIEVDYSTNLLDIDAACRNVG